MNKEWIEVKITTTTEGVEILCGTIYDTDVLGVYIEDKNDIGPNDKNSWDYMDESLISLKEGAILRAYYEESDKFHIYYNRLKDALNSLEAKGEGTITISKVHEEDWENNWKEYFKPFHVSDKLVIKPIWEDYPASLDEIVLKIDPEMAFGTGTHETTRMCLELIEKYLIKDAIVFDIGTGSGILAIAASLYGAKEVVGIDLDDMAVNSAKKNVSYNDLNNVEIYQGNFLDDIEGKADLVIANIIADAVIFISSKVKEVLNENGLFISSGILLENAERVKKELINTGFELIEEKQKGEWVALICSVR